MHNTAALRDLLGPLHVVLAAFPCIAPRGSLFRMANDRQGSNAVLTECSRASKLSLVLRAITQRD